MLLGPEGEECQTSQLLHALRRQLPFFSDRPSQLAKECEDYSNRYTEPALGLQIKDKQNQCYVLQRHSLSE